MKKSIAFTFLWFCLFQTLIAQTGPGGVGDLSGNSSLQLWLRNDAGLILNADESRVKKWLDQSGAENNVSSTGLSKPFYITPSGIPAVNFKGRQFLQAPASSSFFNPTATVFIVKKKSFSGAAISLSPGGFSQELLILNKSIYHHHSSGNFASQSSNCLNSIPNEAVCIVEGVWGPGTTEINYYSNGLLSNDPIIQQGVQVQLSPVNRKITIGQRDSFNPSEYLVGTVYEVIGYNVKLSDSDRIAVESYLACKYNINNDYCGALSPCGAKAEEAQMLLPQDVINIYPNPASDNLYIDFQGSFGKDKIKLRIVNMLGQTELSQMINSEETTGTITLSLDHLKSGNYLLIAEEGEKVFTKKFVVH